MKFTNLTYVFVLSFSVSSSCLCSQIPFTNARVFDFEVGDIIQTVMDVQTGYLYYETTTILSREYSMDSLSVAYVRKKDILVLWPYSDSTHTWVDLDTLFVYSLNDTADAYNYSSPCFTTRKDSFYTDYCNKAVWMQVPKGDSCWNHKYVETWYIEGLGGQYFREYTDHGTMKYYDLVYYSGASGTCGNLVTGIESTNVLRDQLQVFPNPVHDKLFVETDLSGIDYRIVDQLGRLVSSGLLNEGSVKVAELENGAYFIVFQSQKGVISTHRFIVQHQRK